MENALITELVDYEHYNLGLPPVAQGMSHQARAGSGMEGSCLDPSLPRLVNSPVLDQ